MVWVAGQEFKAESTKIVWEVAPYLRGTGLDVGAGVFKVLPHAISVDNGHHSVFGQNINPDVKVKSADEMSIFASQSMDFVYSSHLLEHMENPEKALKEWWRILKVKGALVLYLPHEDLYPKVGTPGANVDHKVNLNEQKIIGWLDSFGWDLERCEQRNNDDEYSFLMVFRKHDGKRHTFSHAEPKPAKTACVVRYGAFGDMLIASSVWAGLKKQGYHVTVFASPPGSDVITEDPNIDTLVLFDKDQVPNGDLGSFWKWQAKKYDKFVNLSESMEGTFLALPGRIQHGWPPALRHKQMDFNYLEFAHGIAEVPHDPQVRFHATDDEKRWAAKEKRKIGDVPVIMWSLAGSSVHKTWAGLDNILASIMLSYPKAHVILVGGPECAILEAGWEKEPRVHLTCGKWKMRQTLAMLEHVDLVIGPETGVLNAASCMKEVAKVVILSHSSHSNLTRDWPNTFPVWSRNTTCPGRGNNEAPACHQMHYGFDNCKQEQTSGVAQCQADITLEQVWGAVEQAMQQFVKELEAA